MKILSALSSLFSSKRDYASKSIDQYKQDVLIRQGRAQFEKLLSKGLSIPVVIL